MSDDARSRYDLFGARRAEAARSAQGFLALVNTQWIADEQQVWPVPGVWAPRGDGGSGLVVRAEASDGIVVDGELVDGEATVRAKDDPEPSTVRFSETVTGMVISGDQGYALRVFDRNSDDATHFSHIDRYDYDPAWQVTARWEEIPGGTLVGFDHLKDEGHAREEVVSGNIVWEFEGETYSLSAIKSGTALQVVFADRTSGSETYSVGRFLFCAPHPDGTITLDFNYAVLPPCAFSYQYNCPLPPANNRLPFPIRAGEKQVIATSGELLHPE